VDLATGERGSRQVHVEPLVCRLTGAEAAIAVNNNAAAVLLTLNTLADGREVIVSRGQLVEIGGSFRMPDVMAKSGCCLVEVGTTNRTRVEDYANAITDRTAAILVAHASNFRMVGFVEEPSLAELATLARQCALPLVHDIGSGALVDVSALRFADESPGTGREPLARESIAAGADVVTFSADKLLGGPQAGIIVGGGEPLQAIRQNPLARAVRLDKTIIAGLEATLRLYADEEHAVRAIPTLRETTEAPQGVRRRARRLRRLIAELPVEAEVVAADAYAGGGSLPGQELRSWAVALAPRGLSVDELAARLRTGEPPVIGRVHHGRLLLDARTVSDDEVRQVAAALRAAFAGESR
jgi:L-seryl-tRNA(Ser) seleniumtransferase